MFPPNAPWEMTPPPPPDPAGRRADLLARLGRVTDPELDRSILEMGFLSEVGVDGGNILVRFALPTYWCAGNFAFMMAADLKAAAMSAPWARTATVELTDHYAESEINRAIAADEPFERAFPGEPAGSLSALRREFARKAFLGRQAALLRILLRARKPEEIARLTVRKLRALANCGGEIAADARRYLEARLTIVGAGTGENAPAFVTCEGDPLKPGKVEDHLKRIRRFRRAADANAAVCGAYLEARRAESPAPVLFAPSLTQWEKRHA